MERNNQENNNRHENNNYNNSKKVDPIDNISEKLKSNANLIKGAIAILFGSYLISMKYYVVVDFALFTFGAGLVLYGLVCLKITRLQEFLAGLIDKLFGFRR